MRFSSALTTSFSDCFKRTDRGFRLREGDCSEATDSESFGDQVLPDEPVAVVATYSLSPTGTLNAHCNSLMESLPWPSGVACFHRVYHSYHG